MADSSVAIRPPEPRDCEAFLEAAAASRTLHSPWVQPPSSAAEFQLYLRRFDGRSHLSRLVCLAGTGAFVGVVNLNHIVRGYLQNATLGFYAFVPHAGHGLMQQGLRLVLREAFHTLALHRVEANIQPGNHRSLRFVAQAGFSREGYSARYLYINHAWRDHERWALLAEDFSPDLPPPPPRRRAAQGSPHTPGDSP